MARWGGHKITAAGQRYLKSGWRQLIDDGPSGDRDADLRVVLLALWGARIASLALSSCANRQ
jgi:hypothetical protein